MDRQSAYAISLVVLLPLGLNSCKVRGGASHSKENTSEQSSTLEGATKTNVDLSKAPIFVHCVTPKEASPMFDVSIKQDQPSGASQISYRIGQDPLVAVNGRWDNNDEVNAYQYIYSFASLRFILTNDQIVSGSLPATFVGSDNTGKYFEQTLLCSKS